MKAINEQKGQALPLALILVTVAALLVAFLVPQFHTVSRSQVSAEKDLTAYYAAEAGMNMVMADLSHGAAAASEGYKIPVITLNGYTPEILVSTVAEDAPKLDSKARYLDPNTKDPQLKQVRAGNGYLLRLYDVHPGKLQVNWAYSPSGLTKIGVWRGETSLKPGKISSWPEEEPLYVRESDDSYNQSSLLIITSAGTYDIAFFNPLWKEEEIEKGKPTKVPNSDKRTSPFNASGDRESTWLFVDAYKDYIISSTVAKVSIRTYVRQVPGPCAPPLKWTRDYCSWSLNEVVVYSRVCR